VKGRSCHGLRGPRRSLVGAVAIGALGLLLAACGGTDRSSSSAAANADYGTLVDAGAHLLRSGNIGAATQLFEQAIAKNPADPVGHYDLGVVDQEKGDTKQALREYSQALADDPNYVPALYNKASIFKTRTPLLAIFYYRKVISLRPNAASALLDLGLLLSARQPSRAAGLRALAKAISLQPSLRADIPPQLRGAVRESR
jgi:Tfp pilus assembly protein PilF